MPITQQRKGWGYCGFQQVLITRKSEYRAGNGSHLPSVYVVKAFWTDCVLI
jgi:hypothetical protein